MAWIYSFKNNRAFGSVDIYQKNAVDLIANNPIAKQSGVSQFRGNGASIRTKGVDILINTRNIVGDFQWTSSAIFNYNVDKVTDYKIKQTTNLNLVTNNFNNPIEGYPYYAVFSFPSAGLDANGNPQGYLSGEISSDYSRILSTYDPQQLKYYGSGIPRYFGSFINTFTYKNFELSLNAVFKFDYYFKRSNVFSGSDFRGSIAGYNKRWMASGDELITRIPAFTYPDALGAGFFQNSEDVIERGDHIRLQDVRFSYSVSERQIRRIGFSSANFFLYAKNLGILWRKNEYKIDPDFGTSIIPQPFSFSAGFNLNF